MSASSFSASVLSWSPLTVPPPLAAAPPVGAGAVAGLVPLSPHAARPRARSEASAMDLRFIRYSLERRDAAICAQDSKNVNVLGARFGRQTKECLRNEDLA